MKFLSDFFRGTAGTKRASGAAKQSFEDKGVPKQSLGTRADQLGYAATCSAVTGVGEAGGRGGLVLR
jgi:hypothetical protein